MDRDAEIARLREELTALRRRVAELETAPMHGAILGREQLYHLLDTLPVYIILLSADYRVTFTNRFFTERFGEADGRPCYEYLFERGAPCEDCETYHSLQTGAPHHWVWTGPDRRIYDIYDYPFQGANGAQQILEVGLDITERVRAESALKEANESLERRVAERTAELHQLATLSERTLESLPGIFYLYNEQGRFIRWNRNWERVTGYTSEEVVRRSPLDYFEGEDRRLLEERIRQVFSQGEARIEAEIITKDGRKIPYDFSGLRIEIDGAPYLIGMGIDITERRHAEEALRRANDELDERVRERTAELRAASSYARSLLEASPDPLVAISPAGVITDVNRATEDATGLPREQLIGSDFGASFTEPERAREGYRRVLSEGEVRDYPLTIRHTSGRTIDVLYNASVYRNEAGELQGVFAAARDITARKRAEEALQRQAAELERSNADLQQFAYVASHDLQEPLRMVASFTQLLQQRYADQLDEAANEFIGFAVDGANRMQHMINDLLVYSRVNTRGADFEPVDMNRILAQVLANLQLAIHEHDAIVTHRPLPAISADATQMEQLLQNLVSNAIKFRGDAPPRVAISAQRKRGEWVFAVQDNGIGISPEYSDRIFLFFQRLHSRDRYAGSGIGLPVCKRIVERHGGRIWVESTPGSGSTFYFSIPERKRTHHGR